MSSSRRESMIDDHHSHGEHQVAEQQYLPGSVPGTTAEEGLNPGSSPGDMGQKHPMKKLQPLPPVTGVGRGPGVKSPAGSGRPHPVNNASLFASTSKSAATSPGPLRTESGHVSQGSDIGDSAAAETGLEKQFQSTIADLSGNAVKPGDPKIELSMAISTGLNDFFGLTVENKAEFTKKKDALNKMLTLPDESLFPEDTVGSSDATLGLPKGVKLIAEVVSSLRDGDPYKEPLKRYCSKFRGNGLNLELSPPARITLGKEDRIKAGIPSSAVFYCFSYPCGHNENKDDENDSKDEILDDAETFKKWGPSNGRDIYQWLTVGAFVYFDDVLVDDDEKKKLQKESSQKSEASGGRRDSGPSEGVKRMGTMFNFNRRASNASVQLSAEDSGLTDNKSENYAGAGVEMKHTYHVVAINSVSDISWGIEKSASLSLFFGTPLKMPDSAIQALGAVGGGKNRWHDVTAKKIRGENRADHLYTHFAWVLPAEKLGDGDSFFYSRDGGFAYKRTDETADYYPVVHAHSQLLIAEYVREMDTLQKLTKQDLSKVVDGEAFDEKEAEKLAETKGIPVGVLTEPMVKLMRLQCDLPDAIRKSYVAEKCTVREYLSNACHYTMQDGHTFDAHGESDAVWTVFKIYRHDLSKDVKTRKTRTVRSDFKEVYRLKVWVQSDDWNDRFKSTVETEARLMITIQSQVHHASHALLQEYTLPQDGVEDGGVGHKNVFFKMSHLEGYTLQQAIRVGEKFDDIQTAEAAKHVLNGLTEIHRHNFIHTDINASNVMRVRSAGGYNHVILDVGLATKIGMLHLQKMDGSDKYEVRPEHEKLTEKSKIVPFVNRQMTPEDMQKLVRHPDFVAPELWDWKGNKDTDRYEQSPDYRSDIWSVGVLMFYMLARRNIDTDSKEVDKAATNTYSRSNTNKGDVGQYEEARIKSFRTGRLPFSDDGPDTFYEGKDTYFRKRNDGDPSFADNLKGEKFLMSVKEKICDLGKKSPSVEEFIPEDDRPSVNTRLLATIAKAMMKKKEERFKDAPDMLQAIAQDVTEKGLDEYTIFISYRVKTDSAIAQILFDELNNKTTAQGKLVTCYLDKVRLKDGEDWQKGFISGLSNSAIYIPIVSYGFTAPYHSLSTKFGQDGDEIDKTPAGKKRLEPFRIKGFNLPSWVAMIFNDLFKGWFHDLEDNCLIELMYAMKLKDSAEKEKTVQHKLRSIFPLFVGRQKEDGAMMGFFEDMSDGGGGGYANKGVSIKCKKKVQEYLKMTNVEIEHADWSMAGTHSKLKDIQGCFLDVLFREKTPEDINRIASQHRPLKRHRDMSQIGSLNRSHKSQKDDVTLNLEIVFSVPVTGIENWMRQSIERALDMWLDEDGESPSNFEHKVPNPEEWKRDKKPKDIRVVKYSLTLKPKAPRDGGETLNIDDIMPRLKSTVVNDPFDIIDSDVEEGSGKGYGKNFYLALLDPRKEKDCIKIDAWRMKQKTLDEKGGNGKDMVKKIISKKILVSPFSESVGMQVYEYVQRERKRASTSLRVIVDIIGSKKKLQGKMSEWGKLEDCLDTFGICNAKVNNVVDIAAGPSGGNSRRPSVFQVPAGFKRGNSMRKDSSANQVDGTGLTKRLGDAGPLNDNQLACIRYAVKKKAADILNHVDTIGGSGNKSADQKESETSRSSKKWNDFERKARSIGLGYILFLLVLAAILSPILYFALRECPADTFKGHPLDSWCSTCPAGTGTGGRVGQTVCKPSCSFWSDSQGRSCKDYEETNSLCALSDVSSSIRDLNGISGKEACYACMNQGSAGCIESELPIMNVMKEESGVAAVGLVLSTNNETIYISDVREHRILAMSVADMKWTSLCGGAGKGFKDSTDPSSAMFDTPRGLVINGGRNAMYVADEQNHAIRVVDLASGEVSTLAGSPRTSGYAEGIGTEAHFDGPRGVAFYEGILYVTDSGNHVIRKIDADKRVTTLSGRGTPGFQNVGSGKTLSAMFYFPTGIIVTPKGLLLITDTENQVVRFIALKSGVVETSSNPVTQGEVGTLAGAGYGSQDGDGGLASFQFPTGISMDPDGDTVWITDMSVLGRIRKISLKTRQVSTAYGNPELRPYAKFDRPSDVIAVPNGTSIAVLVAEGFSKLKSVSGYGTLKHINIKAGEGVNQRNKAALVLVDVQECFLETGTLPVLRGSEIVPVIQDLKDKSCLFDLVVFTADFHPANHTSFASTHGVVPLYAAEHGGITLTCARTPGGKMSEASCCPKWNASSSSLECLSPASGCPQVGSASDSELNPSCILCRNLPELCFEMKQMMWPDHCVQKKRDGTDGDWGFAQGLLGSFQTTNGSVDEVVVNIGKYPYIDTYSAFKDNTKQLKTELDDVLKAQDITTLYLTGLATDYCVKWTAEDAVSLGYEVYLITDATKGLYLEAGKTQEQQELELMEYLRSIGVKNITSKEFLEMECPESQGDGANLLDEDIKLDGKMGRGGLPSESAASRARSWGGFGLSGGPISLCFFAIVLVWAMSDGC